jgi:hypothetical protein
VQCGQQAAAAPEHCCDQLWLPRCVGIKLQLLQHNQLLTAEWQGSHHASDDLAVTPQGAVAAEQQPKAAAAQRNAPVSCSWRSAVAATSSKQSGVAMLPQQQRACIARCFSRCRRQHTPTATTAAAAAGACDVCDGFMQRRSESLFVAPVCQVQGSQQPGQGCQGCG